MTDRDLKVSAYAERLAAFVPELSMREAVEWAEALVLWREQDAMEASWLRYLADLPEVMQ